MKNFKSRITKLEKKQLTAMIQELPDIFGEFFITKNNLRLFLKENTSLLFDGLKAGDKIVYDKEDIIFVTGFSDKSPRKYIKFLVKNNESISSLLLLLSWNLKCDLFAKIKINNPLLDVLYFNKFDNIASRGKETLLCRKYIKKDKSIC